MEVCNKHRRPPIRRAGLGLDQGLSAVSGAVRTISMTALLLAGITFQSNLFAQGGVTVVAVPTPVSEAGIALAAPHAAAVEVPSAAGAWGGARNGSEATLSDRVVDYRIEASLDPVKHTIDGKQKLAWRNRGDRAVRSVYLHLYLNAFEGANSTFFTEKRDRDAGFRSDVDVKDGDWGHIELRGVTQGGAKVAWSYVHPDGGPASDHTVVRFDLPQAVAPGATTTLDIAFFDQLPRVVARTGYFGSFHLVGQWFPKIGVLELPGERGATAPRWNVHEFHLNSEFYADFGSYDVKLTVPKGYVVGATGEQQGAPVEKNGRQTYHFVQGDVHDFAWTADKRTAKPLVSTWTGAGSPAVTVSVLYPPEYASNAAPTMQAAKDALSYFSRTLGPYPYKTLTVVIPPHNAGEAGGMEYPTFYTAENFSTLAPDTLSQFGLDFVNIHEFGHGYFYGILASNEFEEPLLDEGLNEYWDQRMLRDRQQKLHATTPFWSAVGLHPVWNVFEAERMGAPREEPADPIGQNAYDRLQSIGAVYSRTAVTMRDLEARIGKEATERAFKAYYARWKFRHPSVADLRESLAEASGQRQVVEALFATQVYRTDKIDDRVDAITSVEQTPQPGTSLVKDKWVEQTAEQAEKATDASREKWEKAHPDARKGYGPFPFLTTVTLRRRGAPVPQTLLVKFADGTRETVQWDDDTRWRQFTWLKAVKAVSAELDPEGRHYLDTNKLDDSRTVDANHAASLRWSFDFSALVQLFLSLIATV
ncbi:MAG TPA: peptidase M1 [Janthinobacterium sp.]|nr:peptidase M1 [Janthinobacterium sp.]